MPFSSTWLLTNQAGLQPRDLMTFKRAEDHERSGRQADAIAEYGKLEGSPLAGAAAVNCGHLYFGLRQYHDAARAFERATRDPHPEIATEAVGLLRECNFRLGRE